MIVFDSALRVPRTSGWRRCLPRTTSRLVNACNVLVQPRRPWRVDIAARQAMVRWNGASPEASIAGIGFACAIGAYRGQVVVPPDLLEWLAPGSSADERWHRLGSDALCLLANTAAGELISLLRGILAVPLTFDQQACEPNTLTAFSLSIASAQENAAWNTVQLKLDDGACCLLAHAMKDACMADEAMFGSLRQPLAISRGSQVLTVAEFSVLGCGDVVFLDRPGYWVNTVHGHPVFAATAGAQGLRIDRLLLSQPEATAMDTGDNAGEDILHADQLPLTLVFELARIELTLAELRQCAEGTTLPLPAALDDFVDIRVNGQKIGKGTLVSIGDALGVRVTRLHDHG